MSPKQKSDYEDDDAGGTTGASGHLQFADFIGTGNTLREDLKPDEKKRLLGVHNRANENSVKKQKEKQDNRKALKEGKVSLQTYRQGLGTGGGSQSPYRPNPILMNEAQFSGIDPQVNPSPSENDEKANEDLRNDLKNEYALRFAPKNAPVFHPKPQYNG